MRSRLLITVPLLWLFLSGTILDAQKSPPKIFPPLGDSLQAESREGDLVLLRVRSTKRGATIGAIAGGSVGLVGGTIVASNMSTLFGGRRTSFPKAVGVGLIVGAAGAVSWGLIGAAVGSRIYRDEWKRVEVKGTSISVSF